MKVTKSIFDKSYIVEAQAIKAAEKEWPQGIPSDVALTRDEATKKYRFIKSTIEAGKPYLVIGGGQYAWACEDANIKVYGNTEAEALEAYKNQLAFEADLKAPALPTNVDLGQALAESGESLDDLKDADAKANASMGLNALKPRFSSCIRPTKLVWDIADCMPKASRKEVMEECVRQGVAYGTARTQYQAWFKASQEALRGDIRQPYEKGTK